MIWRNYVQQLKRNITQISFLQKLQFAISVCEKLIPDYRYFSETFNWGNISALEEGLAHVKEISQGHKFDSKTIQLLISEIEENMPDTDDFGEVYGSLALNSACAINETLKFVVDRDDNRVVEIGGLSYDTEYFKLKESNKNLSESELELELHKEMNWQLEMTKLLD